MSTEQNLLKSALSVSIGGSINHVGDFFGQILRYSEGAPPQASAGTTATNAMDARASVVYENFPLVPVYGYFRDDPTWDAFMDSLQEYRQQLNETDD